MSVDVFVFPTSFAQQRLWFLDQFLPGHAFYNMPFVVRLSKPVDAHALTRSVGELIRRHESLRTTFAVVDGIPVQVIAASLAAPVSTIDLRTHDEADREREARRLAAEERTRPFDLARGPLFRVTILTLGDAGDMLLLTIHHIISDGWSMDVLFRELSELYDAFATQRTPSLPELTVQYADFAVWQREWLTDDVLEQQMAYWRTQLAGVDGRPALPTDHPRSAPLLHAARRPLRWRAARADAVRALAQREASTVFLVLLSAFSTLLARYSGQTDIVVGTPIANRGATETEPLIGFFVNTLAIRTDLSEDPTFIQLLGRVRETVARAFANQDVPFERVVAELTRERDGQRSPLFQVVFAMQSVPGGSAERDADEPGRDGPWDGSEEGAKFDLTLSLVDDGVEIAGWVEYARELFDSVTIERLLDHFERLIDAIVAAPNAPISSLSMTAAAERAQVLEAWNATGTAYPRDRTIHALFEEQAARTPHAVAVRYGTDAITYEELNARANRLARHLRRRGVAGGALVGVWLTPSLDMIVTLLAVLKAGAAYVPLDPSDPVERLRVMLEDAAVAAVVTTSMHAASVDEAMSNASSAGASSGRPAVIRLDAEEAALALESPENLASTGTAADLAYVMYTSGSTGEPKGVAVPHRAVVRLVRETDYLDFSPTHVFAQMSHASFDAATFEIWGALLSGSTLIGVPKTVAVSPGDLAKAIQDDGITVVFITTALFNHVARELPSAFTGVRTLLTGGEAADPAAMRRILEESRPGRLLHVYGPTESTTFATWHHVASVESDDTTIPIGRPIANTRAYVLDAAGQLAPLGVPGELYLGGDGIACGYWRRPDLTAERFLPDPYHTEPGAVMYRTGDLVRHAADGSLVFLGRCDDQIKIRGFRIEPGEVEAALRTHPDVATAVVIAIGPPGDKRLVAYLVMRTDAEHEQAPLPSDTEVRDHLERRLPAWMTPSELVWLDAMPLTPSGKIDRRAMTGLNGRHAGDRTDRASGDVDRSDPESSDAPATPTEQAVADIWREVLSVGRVAASDRFFAIGGHSLLATQVISRIRDRLRVDVSIQVLFTHPTLRDFAQAIDCQRGDPDAAIATPATAPIRRPAAEGGRRQTSFAQQRLWFLAQLDPDSPTYNITDVIPLRGVGDDLVQRALDEIVRRHDILRTSIAAIDGVPMQIVAPAHPVDLAHEDCRARTAVARARCAADARAREASRPFDLASGPLFRARLLRLTSRETHLCLTLHHAIADGWSLQVLRTELHALLDAFADDGPSLLPELPVQYGDYAEWQRERLEHGGFAQGFAWWTQHLDGAPTVLALPSDHPRPAIQTYAGATIGMRIAPAVADGLARLGEQHGATRFMTLLASFAVLLARYSGQQDLIIGVAAAGRTHTVLEPLIGMFVNTLPVRVVLSGDPPFEALLEQVRQSAAGAFAQEDLPFDRLVSELAPARDAGVAPLVQVLFDLQRMPDTHVIDAPAGEIVDQGEGAAKFELTLAMVEDRGGLAASLEYNHERIGAATARRLLRNFHCLLAAIAEDAGRPCSRLPLLSEDERRTLLSEWNAAPAETDDQRSTGSSLTSLVAAHARRTPLAPAIVDADGSLPYADLDARARRLARRLIARGAGPEQPVAVCTNRSRDFIVSLLGILRAGAAYVCLDPEQPPDRLSALFRASGARLLITQRALGDATWSAGHTVFVDDADDDRVDDAADDPVDDSAEEDHIGDPHGLAAIVFTSGSTGHPKGVAIERHSLVHLAETMSREYALTPRDRVLQMAAITFDVAAEEIFPTLAAGAAIVPWTDRTPPAIDELLAFVERFGISVLNLPSPYWHALADAVERQRLALPASLRLVIAGSDKTSFDRLESWQRSVAPGVRWLNAYGVTEATVTSTLYEPSPPLARGNTPWLPVGRPVGGVRAYVLDEHRALLPIGVQGELYLGGEGIAREYVNEPQLTAERFVPDPFRSSHDARRALLYRTGDRARFRADGNIELLGRFDDQLKVRGFRIEPAEVERALEHHPAVRESVVVARQDGPGDPRLVAYVVPRAWPAPAGADLRRFLQARLPDYMVPASFVALRAFPTTAAGKIDRARLPASERGDEAGRAYVPPRTPAERQLAELWASVLGVERVGATDNFFELGGDSILSIQIIARAAEIGLHYTARQLFQHQTVAELAPLAGTARAIVAEQGTVTGPVALTPVQRWFFEQSPIDAHHSNQSVLLRCDREIDPAVMERAFAYLIETHDALRMRFHSEGGTVRQEIAAPGPVAFTRVDLRGLTAEARDAAFERVASECQASLNLSIGPIARACYITLDESSRLLIVVHHLAVDGVSWRILLGDFSAACARLARGEAITLPPKTTSFQQWARRLTEYAATPAVADELSRWVSAAAAVPPLPCDDSNDDGALNTEGSARTVHASLDRAETEALLHRVPHAYRTQVNDVLLCALARGFLSWTGAREIVVDLEGHGREPLFDDVDLSRTVGWFTTIYPVRLDAGDVAAPGEALKGTKEYLRGVPHKGIGYGLLRYLHPDPRMAAPLRDAANVEVSFNYLGQFEDTAAEARELRTADEWAGPQRAPRALRPYLLDVTAAIFDGQLSLSVMYSAARHRRATMDALVNHIAGALRELIAHCLAADGRDCTPSDFPLVRLDERTLARLTGAYRHIEDIYPVSPMQAGLLFHTLLSPDAGEYVEQLAVDLDASLDIDALEHAWSAVTARHPALRTGFVWQDVDEPLQIVWRQVTSRWDVRDWSRVSIDDAAELTKAWLEDDRRRGYDLDEPPLMRFAIAKLPTGQWRLLWSCHHLVLDGWSVPLVLREVWAFYEAFREGREVALAHPRPYRDYVAWLSRQDLGAAETFWRDVLRGFATPTPLVVDTRVPGNGLADSSGHAHGESRRTLGAETTAALQALARQRRVTLNTTVQAAWALILSRYSGHLDVMFGATVSGRPPELRGVEAMVGLFINTLPVRVRLAPDARLADWLESLQEQQSAARQFEYSPLVEVQGWSDVPRGTPLFESVLVFENYPGDDGAPAGADADAGNADNAAPPLPALERTSYPLTIAVVPGARLLIKMTYDVERLQDEAVQRMLGHFETVLTAMAEAADQPLSSLPLLTPDEVGQAAARNQTTASVPFGSCVEMFDAQARLTPDAIAVESSDGALTYADLGRLATRAAHRLRAHGVATDVPVALAVERGRWLAVGMLAILKAGGAYVPLASNYPAERIAFMLDDSTARVVVSQSSQRERVPATDRTILCLDIEDFEADADTAAVLPFPSRESLAYIIYTSGSTGRPKGVALPHGALANLVWWQITASTPRRDARVLQFAPVSFDVCFQECFSTWASGGTVIFVSEETPRDPALLLRAIDAERADRLFLPFVALQQLAETALDAGGALGLREIITAGEQLHITSALRRFFTDRPRCLLHNQYGPSETHVATAFRLSATPAEWPELPPVGWPIANARTHVLDAAMRLVPDGVPGELYIGGHCLARGYWGRDALTADRFVVDPYCRNGHPARLYRTGDLVRARADGALEFLGRLDDQVKIRGFRVEPGEVEAMLRQHPAVAQAAVVAREIRPGERSLLAYVVGAAEVDAAVDAAQLRHYLEGRLPDWMLPSAFIWMDRLPLTPSGKVDRLALPAPDAIAAPTLGFEAPRTTGERALAAIWSELLGVPRVGVRDQFFELGGHSLLATRLIARIRRELGVELPLRAVFATPVLEDLARRLNEADARLARPAIIPRRAGHGPCAVSFAQQRLWLLEQLNRSTVFHVATTMSIDGGMPVEVWRQALNEVIRRHAVLRTTFSVVDGAPVQEIAERLDITLRVDDLRGRSPDSREESYRELAGAEIAAPFDLSRGPLIRARLIRMTDDESRLLLTLHHSVADGWSLSILRRELTLLADASWRGERAPLPDLPIQYADFAGWQREQLQGTALDEHLAYWHTQLEDSPSALDFPADRPRPPVQDYAGASIATRLPAGVARQLRSFGQQEGATLFMTLLSAFAVLLSRQTGHDDLVIGAPVAGRTQAETEPLVGLFLNHLPIRIRLAGAATFRDLVGRVREATLGAFAHQEMPFELLLQHVKPERHASVTPIFQAFFNHLNFGGPTVDPAAGTAGREEEDAETESPIRLEISRPADTWSPFDFTLYSAEQPDGIDLQLAYRTSLYDAERMAELLAQFSAVVHQVCADPSIPLDRISLSTDRSHPVLPDPAAPLAYEWPGAVQRMFQRQALAHPRRLAVRDDEVAWTYSELDARSSRIARRLRADGIGEGDVVAIYAHRSAALVCAILGVLEAGAAYLILDPGYPPRRLAEYVDRAAPAGWITIERAGSVASALQERIDARPWRSRISIGTSEMDDLPGAADASAPARAATATAVIRPGATKADTIACVSFTSGSTGTPKAILQQHGGLSSFAPWAARQFGLTERDRFTMLSGLSHDPLQRDIFTPLAIGASIHIPAADDIGTSGRLVAWMREHGITVANLTPALAQMAATRAATRASSRADHLSLVFFVGEALTRSHVAQVRAWAAAAVCVNLYGATETQRALGYYIDAPATTAAAAVAVTVSGMPARREVLPVGRGVPGTQLLVLAAPDRRAGIGEIGEIYVRSPYLAGGYLGEPSLTAERFIMNPFTRVPGDRMYRTGDLGRYLPDGSVELAGRMDAQTKIRGFRVELAEVEAQLARHPRVREAAVLLRDPANTDAGLAAYVVADGPVTPKELRRFLAESLPDYMAPSIFILIDALPITPNGKLDRPALPAASAPLLASAVPDHGIRGPRDAVEATLLSLWRQALGRSGFGIDDNFFELGGHSLLAAQVLARVADALRIDIPLGRFFERPTIAELSETIATARIDGRHAARPPITPIVRHRHRARQTAPGVLDMSAELREHIRVMMRATVAPARTPDRPRTYAAGARTDR